MTVTMEELAKYREDSVGYCTACEEWTRDATEPDARDYDCPSCGEFAVYGAEEVLLAGLIEVA